MPDGETIELSSVFDIMISDPDTRHPHKTRERRQDGYRAHGRGRARHRADPCQAQPSNSNRNRGRRRGASAPGGSSKPRPQPELIPESMAQATPAGPQLITKHITVGRHWVSIHVVDQVSGSGLDCERVVSG